MSKRFIFSALLVLVLAAGSSLAAENSTDSASPGAEVSASADNTSPVKEETASPASDAGSVAPANLQYIWSVTGVEADQITMVLNQTGKDLSGQAKYEGSDSNPWNAVVVGSVSGNDVNLVLTSLINSEMVSTKLSGAYSADTIEGKFVQTDMTGKTKKSGDFSAVWINPDTSAYTPAQVTEAQAKPAAAPAPAVAQSSDASTTTTTTNAAGTAGVTTSGSTVIGSGTSDAQPKAVQLGGKTQYTDVHKYAQQFEIGGDLSGVPPGMGGGSL